MALQNNHKLNPAVGNSSASKAGIPPNRNNTGLLVRLYSCLRVRFIIAMVIVLLASLYGQITINKNLADAERDIEALNIVGHQRSLIQIIAKEAFRIDEVLEAGHWESMDELAAKSLQAQIEIRDGQAKVIEYLHSHPHRFNANHHLHVHIRNLQPMLDSYFATSERVLRLTKNQQTTELAEQLDQIIETESEIILKLESFMDHLTLSSIDKNRHTRSIGWAILLLTGITGVATLFLVVEPGIRKYRRALNQAQIFAERAEQSEQHLAIQQRAAEQAAVVLNTDLHGTITKVNDKMCEITGYSREELIGANPRLMNSGYHPPEFFDEMYATIQRGDTWRGEMCDLRKDGTVLWADTTIVPMLDHNGKIFQYFSLRIDVTRQKEAEHELHTILDALPSIVLYKDEKHNILRLNKEAADTIGLNQKQILNRKSSEFLTGDDPISSYEDDLEVLVGGEAKMGIIDSFISPNGQHRTMRIDKIPMIDIGGYFSRLVTIATDITEIVEMEQRLTLVIDAAKAGVWDWDISSDTLHTNDRYFTMVGDEAVSNPIRADHYHARIHPDERTGFLSSIQTAKESDQGSFESEFRICCNGENDRWIRWTGKVIESNPDGTAKRIIGQHLDIDPAKRLDLAIRTALELKSGIDEEETLTRLCSALADATQTSFAGVTRLVQKDGKQSAVLIAGSNNGQPVKPFAYELPGTPCNQAINEEFCIFPDGVVEQFPEDHMLVEMQARGYAGLKLINSKGDDIGLLIVIDTKPLNSPVDPMTALKLFAARVTVELEHNASQERLREAAELAESLSRSKSDFLANMSHEIRTPMTAILGFADLLEDDGDTRLTPNKRLEAIKTIQNNGNHLLTIINDILDISKIEAGKMKLELIKIEPVGLIQQVASLMKERAHGKGLEFEIQFETHIPQFITTDPTRLRQILINLIGNAIKFTETGKITVRFSLTDDQNPMVSVEIIDTGIGMTPEQCSHIFDAFTQADSSTSRKFGGTGLGLNISASLARILGGTIRVFSEPEIGSRFVLTIDPGDISDSKLVDNNNYKVSEPEAIPAASLSPTARPLENRRILLVEDGPDNQKLISFHLRKAGATVEFANNGQIAVDLLTSTDSPSYDIVIMDMQMPILDGYRATAALRKIGYTTPIIALTAHAMQGDRQKCLDAGCTAYQTKPIDKILLIAECLDQIVKTQQGSLPKRDAA